MTHDQFLAMIDHCQPHPVFYLDWFNYYSSDFGNTFLPNTKILTAEGVKIYDGVNLFDSGVKTDRKLYLLSDSKYIENMIAYTYTQGVSAQNNKHKVRPTFYEICIFIEVLEDDSVEISFKLGSIFRDFIYSYARSHRSALSPAQIEATIYRTTIAQLRADMGSTQVHYDMMSFVLHTMGIDQSQTYQNNYTQKLKRLMATNDLAQITHYQLEPTPDGLQPSTLTIRPSTDGLDTSLVQGAIPIALDPSMSAIGLLSTHGGSMVIHEIPNTPAPNQGNAQKSTNNDKLKKACDTAQMAGIKDKLPTQPTGEIDLYTISQHINAQLANPFYSNVKMRIRIRQMEEVKAAQRNSTYSSDGQILGFKKPEPKVKHSIIIGDPDNWEVAIDIVIDPDGTITIRHGVSERYLADTRHWADEIKRRELDLDINALKQEIITDFTATETVAAFTQAFMTDANELSTLLTGKNIKQNIERASQEQQQRGYDIDQARKQITEYYKDARLKAGESLDKCITSYIEAIQATQKVTKNVWEQGTINESLWWRNAPDDEHQQWPAYMSTHPLVGGATDGVIDEVIGIPVAIKGIYHLATDEKKRAGLRKVFTKDGMSALIDGLIEDVKETYHDHDKSHHFAAQTTVSAVFMLTGYGELTKSKELTESLELVTDVAQGVTNPKVLRLIDDVKKGTRLAGDENIGRELLQTIDHDVLAEAADEIRDIARSKGKKPTWEEIKKLFERGNNFNASAKRNKWYPHNEVWVEHPFKTYPKGHKNVGKPVRYRLDSYDTAEGGKIVSRKATTLENIQLSTFEKYCKEVVEKYPEGSKIANKEIGEKLVGKHYLEIPESNKSFKRIEEYTKLAREKYNIELIFKKE
jgi:hypothetical protein